MAQLAQLLRPCNGKHEDPKCKIEHPCLPDASLNFICDVPYIMKCIRNHLMKHKQAQIGKIGKMSALEILSLAMNTLSQLRSWTLVLAHCSDDVCISVLASKLIN